MKAEQLNHRALMLLINAKTDYLISELQVANYLLGLSTADNKSEQTAEYRRKAREKLEREVRKIVANNNKIGG